MATLPADTHIGSVTLTVRDLDRSRAFYQQVLGFHELARSEGTVTLGVEGGRALMTLEELPGGVPRPRRTAGLFHVAILVPSRAALGRSLRRLVDRGWPLSGVADHLVSEALYLDDPEGLGLEIYRDRPRDTWRRHGTEILMGTDPLDIEALAQEPGAERPWEGLEQGTVIGHVHLQVPDLESAEAFYCGGIGFEPEVAPLSWSAVCRGRWLSPSRGPEYLGRSWGIRRRRRMPWGCGDSRSVPRGWSRARSWTRRQVSRWRSNPTER